MSDDGQTPSPGGASRLALGSWHIFSRLTLEEGTELVRAALERGIRDFDIGDYWDHELLNTVRFREIVERLGLRRDDYRVGVKLFTNSAKSRADALSEEMERMGVDYVDYALCARPSHLQTLEQDVRAMAGLVDQGLAKSLAVYLWEPERLAEAMQMLRQIGGPQPKFVQYQYNVARRTVVESEGYEKLFSETDLKFQPTFTLEGGLLAGHVARRRYGEDDRARGEWFAADDRNMTRDMGQVRQMMRDNQPRFAEVSASFGVSPAELAMAFAATHRSLDTLLFGATKVWQLDEALVALQLARDKRAEILDAVEEFRLRASGQPPSFDPAAGFH